MKSYRTLALKELLSQKVTSILILIAVVLSTMMTTIVGQSIGVLSAMREQQAIAIGGNPIVPDGDSYWYASWLPECQRNFRGSYRLGFP